jgi:hypothetical protein
VRLEITQRSFIFRSEEVMKKILVLSDSHGNVENMVRAVESTDPDMMIHLGDCWSDADELMEEFPDIPMERVPGNCDISQEPAERILIIEGKKIMICHGHTMNVKSSYLNLQYKAQERKVDAALFGHTHRIFYGEHNRIVYLNPGTIGNTGLGVEPSYGVLWVDGKDEHILYSVGYV